MSTFLTVSEIDTAIQERMAQQAPDETKRLAAINNALQDIYAKYDIDSAKREIVSYIVFDGQPTKISSLVSDFKRASDLRLLAPNKQSEEFAYIDDDAFTVHIGENRLINEFTVAYANGNLFLKANRIDGNPLVQLDGMGSSTGWTASSDATTPIDEEVVVLTQAGNVSFGVDVSASVNNYAIISKTITSLDLSSYQGLGRARFWCYIPSVTNFTSVELRWGNDASNYWSGTATTQADGSALATGWNFINIDWSGATETGTVDETVVDYLAIKMNYAAGYTDQSGFRIEAINLYLPVPIKFVYWTYYISQTSASAFQEEGTTTTGDTLLLPKRFKSLVTFGALKYLYPIALGSDAEIPLRIVRADYDKELENLQLDIADRAKTPVKKIKLRPGW